MIFEPLRSALVRLAAVKSMRALPLLRLAVSLESLRSAWARPAPFSLIAPAPVNVAPSKSPYDRCAPLRSSSSSAVPSVVWLHATGQLLSPAVRCLSISTVHGGAGGDGASEAAKSIGSHCGGTVRGFDEVDMLELSLRSAIATAKKRAALTRTARAPEKLTVQRFTGISSFAGAA